MKKLDNLFTLQLNNMCFQYQVFGQKIYVLKFPVNMKAY